MQVELKAYIVSMFIFISVSYTTQNFNPNPTQMPLGVITCLNFQIMRVVSAHLIISLALSLANFRVDLLNPVLTISVKLQHGRQMSNFVIPWRIDIRQPMATCAVWYSSIKIIQSAIGVFFMYFGALIIAQTVKTCSVSYLFIKLYIYIYNFDSATSWYPPRCINRLKHKFKGGF